MHETSLIRVILETVTHEMDKCGATRLNRLTLRVGTLTAVEPEALQFAFNASIEETAMEGATLEIIETELTGQCKGCGTQYPLLDFDSPCPNCDGGEIMRLTGTELDIISIDVD